MLLKYDYSDHSINKGTVLIKAYMLINQLSIPYLQVELVVSTQLEKISQMLHHFPNVLG